MGSIPYCSATDRLTRALCVTWNEAPGHEPPDAQIQRLFLIDDDELHSTVGGTPIVGVVGVNGSHFTEAHTIKP